MHIDPETSRQFRRAVDTDLDHAAWLHQRLDELESRGTPRRLFYQWEAAIHDGYVSPRLEAAFLLWAQASRSLKKERHRLFFEQRVEELTTAAVPWQLQPAPTPEQAALEAEAEMIFARNDARRRQPGYDPREAPDMMYRGTAWDE